MDERVGTPCLLSPVAQAACPRPGPRRGCQSFVSLQLCFLPFLRVGTASVVCPSGPSINIENRHSHYWWDPLDLWGQRVMSAPLETELGSEKSLRVVPAGERPGCPLPVPNTACQMVESHLLWKQLFPATNTAPPWAFVCACHGKACGPRAVLDFPPVSLPSRLPAVPPLCPHPPVGTLSDCGLHVPLRRAGMKRAGARQWGPVVLTTRSFGSWWDRRVSRAFLLSLSLSPHHPLSLLHAPPSPLGTLHFHRIPSMSPSWPADPRGPGSLLLCRCWEQRGTC